MNKNLSSTESSGGSGALHFEPGGFWRRLAAVLVDAIILMIITFPFNFVKSLVSPIAIKAGAENSYYQWGVIFGQFVVNTLIGSIISSCYCGWFYNRKGATPGKMLLGLRVVHSDTGTYLSFWQGVGREWGKFISSIPFFLGYLWALFRPDKRTWHDLIFKTQVLQNKSNDKR